MKNIFILTFILLFFAQCGPRVFSIVENPKKPGKYPKLTKTQAVLARSSKRRTSFDVTYNKLDIQIDPAKKFLSGRVIIRGKALIALDTIQIDLYKNLKLKSVKQAGVDLVHKRVEGAIFVKMPETKAGETFSIEVSYEGNPVVAKRPPWDGGSVWKKDFDNYPWCGVACETEGASLWWPNKDDVSDEADSTDILLTVADTLTAVSNGVLQKTIQNNNRTKTFHWHISYPINNYNVTYYVGNFKLLEDYYRSEVSGLDTKFCHYVLPQHYDLAKKHFEQAKKHIAFYEEAFGPYPWQRDGYKLIESPYEGMEHQSAIAYGNGFRNEAWGFDYIILHESAHEWWGNSVTAADLSDVWLQEGFATYSEAMYVDRALGHESYLLYMHSQKFGILNKRPVVRKREIRYFSADDEDVYNKGSWILHSLRGQINDDQLFFDIMRTFRVQNNCKQIYTESFTDLVNKKTGKDYNWFFNQYLYNREAPMLEFCLNGKDLYFRWKNTADDFDKLAVKIKDGNEFKTLYPTNKLQKTTLDTEYPIARFDESTAYFGVLKNDKLKKAAIGTSAKKKK